MAGSADAPDPWYLALLGFAEHFRTSSPPKIRLCVHCLQAVFQFKPPARVEARTHLQLGSVLYRHTKNCELAQTHLEKAVSYTLGDTSSCVRMLFSFTALSHHTNILFSYCFHSGSYLSKYPFSECEPKCRSVQGVWPHLNCVSLIIVHTLLKDVHESFRH